MARTPKIISLLNTWFGSQKNHSMTRREFVSESSKLMLMGSLVPTSQQSYANTSPVKSKIAIVGAGLAGLTAAYYLKKAGLAWEMYEAQDRIGGRIISAQNIVADGITTEIGGEFIDSTHKDVLALCRKFNLPLLDMKASGEEKLTRHDYFIGDRRITESEIIDAFSPFALKIQRDLATLPEIATYNHPAIIRLDNLSIDDYLHNIGVSGWLFDLLTTSFTSELGLISGNQSSLNLLSSLSLDTTNGFEIYGDSDERYKVLGGNQRIGQSLQTYLKRDIRTGYQLTRLAAFGSGYQLSFENGREVRADIVIITLPFSVLRNVELNVDMPARKRRCIEELGYGTQSKLFVGVQDRIWRPQGFSGYVLSDQIHNGWDSSQMQKGNSGPGGYSLFLGADKGVNLNMNQYEYYVDQCDKVYPGLAKAANRSRKGFYNWNQNPMVKGAYACYKTGQMSSIGQAESQRVGNIFFAGEHCSEDFQGYMNGAAETGRKAAEKILKLMKI